MFVQTIVIVGVMLILLMLISTLGGSMNRREKFIDSDDGEEDRVSGNIIRRTEKNGGEGNEGDGEGTGNGGNDGGVEPYYSEDDDVMASRTEHYYNEDDAVMIPETVGSPDSSAEETAEEDSGAMEAFDGDMWAAY